MSKSYTYFDLLEHLRGKGYYPPMGIEVIESNKNKKDGKIVGTGENIKGELELDRVNVFKAFYGDEWYKMITLAHGMVADDEKITSNTIDLLMKELPSHIDGVG